MKELAKLCRSMRIKTHGDYLKKYPGIPGAPSNLARQPDYPGWFKFIRIGAESESKEFLRELGIFHLNKEGK